MLLIPNLVARRMFSTITTSTFEEFIQYSSIFLNSLKALLRYGLLDSADCEKGEERRRKGEPRAGHLHLSGVGSALLSLFYESSVMLF